MIDRGPDCGALYSLVGLAHLCRGFKNGEHEGPPRIAVLAKTKIGGRKHQRRGVGFVTRRTPVDKSVPADLGGAAVDASPRLEVRSPKSVTASKRGRPRIEEIEKTLKATKPWEKLGMSERTWYRRQTEKRNLK